MKCYIDYLFRSIEGTLYIAKHKDYIVVLSRENVMSEIYIRTYKMFYPSYLEKVSNKWVWTVEHKDEKFNVIYVSGIIPAMICAINSNLRDTYSYEIYKKVKKRRQFSSCELL